MPPPPPNTPNCPTWTPPPPMPPPPPKGASGQQLVGGVVGVQNRGVAPPGVVGVKYRVIKRMHTVCPLCTCHPRAAQCALITA